MNETKGVIYILTNPSFPQYVKIGYADDVEQRLKEFNSNTCVPFGFRIYATYEVSDRLVDTCMHSIFDIINSKLRASEEINGKLRKREFFAISAEEAYNVFYNIARVSDRLDRLKLYKANKAEQKEEDAAEIIDIEASARKENFSFSKCGIEPGEQIEFIHDTSIKCRVVNDKYIEYNGKAYSMSGLAKILLKRKGQVQGTLHFSYKGEILTNRRDRLGV